MNNSVAGKLHHVEIYVSDLKISLAFWDWFLKKLGYEDFQNWDAGHSFRREETYIVFVQAERRYLSTEFHRCHAGLNHLAFHAASRAQVDEMTNEVRAKGYTILYEDKHPFAGGEGYYALFCEDPERIKVELVAPDEQSS